MILYLSEKEIGHLVDIADAVNAVESVGRSMAARETIFEPRTRLRMKNGFLHLMPASMENDRVFGYKAYTSFKGKARFFVHLFDGETGVPLAIMEGDKLGQLRTGAASAAATRVLARRNAESFGLFGSGYQAESQLEAVLSVKKFKDIRVYSRNFEHAQKFSAMMGEKLGMAVRAVKDPAEAASCDVVTTITAATSPVLSGEFLRPGCHVNAAGGNMLVKRELDERAVERAGLIVIDGREQGKKECGDFLPLIEKGKLHWDDVREFGDLFSGAASRSDDEEITLFKSQGIAPWDVALAKVAYERAVESKTGTSLNL